MRWDLVSACTYFITGSNKGSLTCTTLYYNFWASTSKHFFKKYLGFGRCGGKWTWKRKNKKTHQLIPNQFQEHSFYFKTTTFPSKLWKVEQVPVPLWTFDFFTYICKQENKDRDNVWYRALPASIFYSHLTYFKTCISTSVQKKTYYCKVSHTGCTHQGSPSKLKVSFYADSCQNLRN